MVIKVIREREKERVEAAIEKIQTMVSRYEVIEFSHLCDRPMARHGTTRD